MKNLNNQIEMTKKQFKKELKKVPNGRIPMADYVLGLHSKGNSYLAIRLAEECGGYGVASEIAMEKEELGIAMDNAGEYFREHNNSADVPLRTIEYLEKRGAEKFPEWENTKNKLKKKSMELYNIEIQNLEELRDRIVL